MNTATISSPFIGSLNDFLPLNPNKISTIKHVITFTTDEKSAKESGEFVEHFIKTKEALISSPSEFDLDATNTQLDKINDLIKSVDSLLCLIGDVLEMDHNVPTEIIIDDPYMPIVLQNLHIGKEVLQYISDYLQMTIDIQSVKQEISEGKFKEYTIIELLDLIKAA